MAVSVRLVRLLVLPEKEMVPAKAMSLSMFATNVPMNDSTAVRLRRVDFTRRPINASEPLRVLGIDRNSAPMKDTVPVRLRAVRLV